MRPPVSKETAGDWPRRFLKPRGERGGRSGLSGGGGGGVASRRREDRAVRGGDWPRGGGQRPPGLAAPAVPGLRRHEGPLPGWVQGRGGSPGHRLSGGRGAAEGRERPRGADGGGGRGGEGREDHREGQ